MKKSNVLVSATLLSLVITYAQAQTEPDALDEYISGAHTIIIAKCVGTGPENILGRAVVDVEVLHVVKGDRKLKTFSTTVGGGLEDGRTYLIRIPNMEKSGFGRGNADYIPVGDNENIAELRLLPSRIVVLRTINLRLSVLETLIRSSTYEAEQLRAIKQGN